MHLSAPLGFVLLSLSMTGCFMTEEDSLENEEEGSFWSAWLQGEDAWRIHAHEFNGAAKEPVFTWDMQTGFKHGVALAADAECKNLLWQAQDVSSPVILNDVEDGIYYGCVWACKKNHACSEPTNQGVKLMLDRTPPVLDQDIADIKANQPFSLDLWVKDLTYVSFYWEVLDGPGTVLISDQVASRPSFSMTESGTYIMQLTLTDDFMNRTSKHFRVEWSGSHKHASR